MPQPSVSAGPRPEARSNTARKIHRAAQRPSQTRVLTYRLLLVIVGCALWEGSVRAGLIRSFWVSSPTLILTEFVNSLLSGTLVADVSYSVYEALLAFVISSVLGIATGLLLARSSLWDEVLAPFITAINTMPRVALAPLIMLWFGIGLVAKVVTAMTLVYFILLVNTLAGAKNVDNDVLTIARLMGATERDLLRKVILPSSVPWIFAGLNLGLTYSLLGVVVAEILSSNRGIGFVIAHSAGNFNTTGVFVGLMALVIVAWFLNWLMRLAEGYLLKWKPSTTTGG